ncbi:PHB depolymerase family esterase [Amycolatopsis oliviviridis]|uniref:Polyhydroxybutyrate depolymerase n=1 Tax=Amycolatopsis oliviviridis TaxID=1471590 RepID=A0ABQ3LKN1_9PSEU|nr:ferulic acid esterase [Amycolatopsis oliviviridis]GHH17097.1 polyhydroxybutyrate depolymerase [Amycolatopsis oliviviridis]
MPGPTKYLRRLALTAAAAAGLSLLAVPAASAAPSPIDSPVRTTGCHRPSPVPAGATTLRTLTSGGLVREYTVHVPARYQPSRPYPLVLSFHGHKRTSKYQEELSGFSAYDAISVYPQGLVGTDGESAWTGAPYSAAADDVLFTSDLLNTLQRELCVDSRRIYATGKSNGGGFVGVLACRLPGRIAAFAPVAGAFYPQGGECHPSRPAPILDFHGTADTTIPYTGNPAKGLPTLPDWLTAWADRNGCFPRPIEYSPKADVTVQRWLGCSLQHYRVEGAGHVWPSTGPNNDSATPTVIDATPVIWKFLLAHRLR